MSYESNARRKSGAAGVDAAASVSSPASAAGPGPATTPAPDAASLPASAAAETTAAAALEEAQLVAAARADRQAFAAIYLRFADRLYRYALARSGSAALAEDVVSETMLAALEGIGRFDARRGTLAGWLFGIATHRIAERTRRQARWLRAADRLQGQQSASGGDEVLESTLRGEAAQVVARLLQTLDERDRQIVLLHYSADLNSTEIGEVLDMRPGTVRQRLARALRAMQQQLPPESAEQPERARAAQSVASPVNPARVPSATQPTTRVGGAGTAPTSAAGTGADEYARWRKPSLPAAQVARDAATGTDADTDMDADTDTGTETGTGTGRR